MSQVAKWTIITVLTIGTLLTIREVGKPRSPLTPDIALGVAIFNGLIIGAMITLWRCPS